MTRAVLILLLTAGSLTLPGCETIKGFGRDITNTAEALDRTF